MSIARWRRTALALLIGVAGCASDADLRESQRLLADGKPEESLRMLEAASKVEPRRVQAYNAYITQRNALVAAYVRDGDDLRARRDFDNAEQQYSNALRLDPLSEAARSGLGGVQRDRKAEALAVEATDALRQGDLVAAERKARTVLDESPSNRTARGVMRSLNELRARADSAPPQLKGLLSRRITVDLRDATLRSVLDILQREAGLNFIVDRDVRSDARTTISVRDSNVEDVLKLVMLMNQLDRKVLNDNTLLIYPTSKQREYQELVMRSFYLANADVKQTASLIRAMVKTKELYIDEKINLLIMRDTPDAVALAEQLVATQDLPEPEVMLEVEVLEVSSSIAQNFGFSYPTQVSVGPVGTSTDPNAIPTQVQLGSGRLRAFVANPLLLLSLSRNDGTSNLLANPRIRVRNRDKAHVLIGERVPVITTTSTANVGVSSSVNYLETGLKLDVEPNVYLDDEVSIKISLEVSNILEQLNVSGTVAYRLGTRSATTSLRLKDGETQILAGLINNEDRRSVAKVPLVGDVPVFGRLFRNDNDSGLRSEVILLLTPRVVRNVSRPTTVASQFPAGTEASPGAPPLRLTASKSTLNLSTTEGPATMAAAQAPKPSGQIYPLVVAAPTQVRAGDDFTMVFTLPTGNQAVNATLDIAYDKTVLALVSNAAATPPPVAPAGGTPGAAASPTPGATPPAGTDSGHATLYLASTGLAGVPPATTQLTFKVIAKAAAQTKLELEVSSEANISAPSTYALSVLPR